MKKAILFTIIVHLACISPIRSQDVLAKQASIDKKAKSTEAVQSDNFNQSERQGVTTNAFENLIHKRRCNFSNELLFYRRKNFRLN